MDVSGMYHLQTNGTVSLMWAVRSMGILMKEEVTLHNLKNCPEAVKWRCPRKKQDSERRRKDNENDKKNWEMPRNLWRSYPAIFLWCVRQTSRLHNVSLTHVFSSNFLFTIMLHYVLNDMLGYTLLNSL